MTVVITSGFTGFRFCGKKSTWFSVLSAERIRYVSHPLAFLIPSLQVKELAESVLRDPIFLTVGTDNAGAANIDQRLVYVGREEGKLLAIRQVVQEGLRPPVLVFLQSKDRAKVQLPSIFSPRVALGGLAFDANKFLPAYIHLVIRLLLSCVVCFNRLISFFFFSRQALFHELVYDGINADVMHASRTQVRSSKLATLADLELLSRTRKLLFWNIGKVRHRDMA